MNSSLVSAPFRQTTFWKVALGIFAGAVLLHVLFAATLITVRWDRTYIDTVTGTREFRTEWLTGWESAYTEKSPLEERLTKAGMSWRQNRIFIHGNYRPLLGNATIQASGSSAEIYLFDYDSQQSWIDASSDTEILQFVKDMESDDVDAQKAAIARAWDKVFDLHNAHVKTRQPR